MKIATVANRVWIGGRLVVLGGARPVWRPRTIALTGCLSTFLLVWPICLDAGTGSDLAHAGRRRCERLVLSGKVNAGSEWREPIGEGWVLRVVPIGSSSARSSQSGAKGKDVSAMKYSGWDLVMDRDPGTGYPDALLLATPPYGSVNEREIGTTFGMRAQDAIAWEPRKFHFFTTAERAWQARGYFSRLFSAGGSRGESGDSRAENANLAADASRQLLRLISNDPKMGYGELSITDARIVSGIGDPPAFARGWAGHLSHVPHSLEQASSVDFMASGGSNETAAKDAGVLRWIQFTATLWLPSGWKVPRGSTVEAANCAE